MQSTTIELLPGSVLDGRFCVSTRLGLEAGRPLYAAFDLIDHMEVELLVAPGPLGQRRGYHVRPRRHDAQALEHDCEAAPPDAGRERRALTRFVDRIALTGVSMQQGDDGELVYTGWDRKLGRTVRVTVEPVDAMQSAAQPTTARGDIDVADLDVADLDVDRVA